VPSTLRLLPVVAAGGVVGSLARYRVDIAIPRVGPGDWPWSTFLVNVVGSLAIGVLIAWLVSLAERDVVTWWSGLARPFLVTGILGGFTTFSAYAVQVRDLAVGGSIAAASLYAVGSVVVTVLAVSLGLAIGRRLVGAPAAGLDR